MSQYLVISRIDIQNANAIAGLTWGFPAITHFLGFIHALGRKMSNDYGEQYATHFSGCGVVSHTTQNKVYKPSKYADFEFLQSKNPPVLAKHKNKKDPPPIIEEGKMNLTISLVIELNKPLTFTSVQINQFEEKVLALCRQMRIAGGSVLNIEKVKYLTASTEEQHQCLLRKIKRLTMPGFVLFDRSEYLQAHFQTQLEEYRAHDSSQPQPELLDAWLDFSAQKFKAKAEVKDGQTAPDANTPAKWEYVDKPFAGYLVPLMTGYKAISDVYEPGEVLNTRDATTPTCFVEAIHSVGEWKSVHRTKKIEDLIWRYRQDGQWYLCQQNHSNEKALQPEVSSQILENINEVLNSF